jgi:hypothetical protein
MYETDDRKEENPGLAGLMSVYDDSDSESKSEAKKSSRFLDPDEGQNISTTIEPGVIPDSKNDSAQ